MRKVFARMEPGKDRKKDAVARCGKRDARESEQVAVERRKCRHQDEQCNQYGGGASPGSFHDESSHVLRLGRRLSMRIQQRVPGYDAKHTNLQQHVERRNKQHGKYDGRRNRPLGSHDFIPQEGGFRIPSIVVERNEERAPEAREESSAQLHGLGKMKRLREICV